MSKSELNEEWDTIAPRWIADMRNTENPIREILLDPLMIDLCGDVSGKDVIDLGCGEGRFTRKLADKGSVVLGLDTSRNMIEAANDIAGIGQEFRVMDVENLKGIDDESFDLAISYLNQCDLQDFDANTKEAFRVLRNGGKFVIANLHPMRSATGIWCRNEDNSKRHAILDNYFDESQRHWKMLNCDLTNFHRTMSTYINTFLGAGFTLERLVEPTPSQELGEKFEDLFDELRVPNFVIYSLRK